MFLHRITTKLTLNLKKNYLNQFKTIKNLNNVCKCLHVYFFFTKLNLSVIDKYEEFDYEFLSKNLMWYSDWLSWLFTAFLTEKGLRMNSLLQWPLFSLPNLSWGNNWFMTVLWCLTGRHLVALLFLSLSIKTKVKSLCGIKSSTLSDT